MAAFAGWLRGDRSEIHKAASSGDLSKVLQHIETNQDLDSKDSQQHTPLSLAARHGHFQIVKELLATNKVNPDARNHIGRTPLFLACMYGHREVVRHLKDHSRVNLNSKDDQSETPLSQAAKNGHAGVVKDLLATSKIDPDCRNGSSRTALSQASEAGHLDVVRQFVANGRVDFNATDAVSDTALSLAARQGHAEIVRELLLTNKVNPNAKNVAGRTPLSLAAGAGHLEVVEALLRDRTVDVNTRDAENMTPLLYAVEDGYVDVSKRLLAAGAVASLVSSYGQAAQDLVREKLLSTTNEEDHMKYKRIKSLLEAPPPINRRGSAEGEVKYMPVTETVWPPDSVYRRSGVCKSFQARVEFHKQGGFQPWIAPVWDVLYGSVAPEQLITWKRSYSDWKWFHLPANNKVWVKDLIHTLCLDGTIAATVEQAHKFFEDSFLEAKGSTAHTSYRRPGMMRGSLTSTNEDFSIVIPYFDRENKDYLDHRYREVPLVPSQQFQVMQNLEDGYKTRAHSSTEDLHISRTLDQSYYTSLADTKDRDYDQVIYRYTANKARAQRKIALRLRSNRGDTFSDSECASFLSAEGIHPDDIKGKAIPQLLMVHSIWIWKLGDTIISAFPDRWCIGPNSLLDQMLLHPTTASLQDALFRIVRETVGFVDEPCNAGLDENWYSIFEQSIADQAYNETVCYQAFETMMDSHTAEDKIEDKAWDVLKEMAHLRIIKDIRDELHMIKRVISEQDDVIEALYAKADPKRPANSKVTYVEERQLMENMKLRLQRVDKLELEALMVEQRFNGLLDIKQKQGNLMEARDTKRLADKAEQRALESEFQSRVLFVFTIVTVIFTPISFICSLYAIPSADYPKQGGGTSWSISRIGTAMGVSEIVILLPILFYWIYTKFEPQVAKRFKWPAVKVSVTYPSGEADGGEPKVPKRQDTAGTIPTINFRQDTVNTLPPSNSKFLQVISRRVGTAHLDASDGV